MVLKLHRLAWVYYGLFSDAQMVSQWRERRDLLPRCSATRCAACAVTRPLAFTTTCWAAKAARASFDAVSSKARSTPARTTATVRWTCTCAASASSVGCASAGRRACWSTVSYSATWESEGGNGFWSCEVRPACDMQVCSPRSKSGWRRWRSSRRRKRPARPQRSPQRLPRNWPHWIHSSRRWLRSWWPCRSSATRGLSSTGQKWRLVSPRQRDVLHTDSVTSAHLVRTSVCASNSRGHRVRICRTEKYVSRGSPTSPSWLSCRCRRSWILPSSFPVSWSSHGRIRSHYWKRLPSRFEILKSYRRLTKAQPSLPRLSLRKNEQFRSQDAV